MIKDSRDLIELLDMGRVVISYYLTCSRISSGKERPSDREDLVKLAKDYECFNNDVSLESSARLNSFFVAGKLLEGKITPNESKKAIGALKNSGIGSLRDLYNLLKDTQKTDFKKYADSLALLFKDVSDLASETMALGSYSSELIHVGNRI